MRDSIWTASSRLLLPAALGPNSTVSRGKATSRSVSDLKPCTLRLVSITASDSPRYSQEHGLDEPLLLTPVRVELRKGVGQADEVRAAVHFVLEQSTESVRPP